MPRILGLPRNRRVPFDHGSVIGTFNFRQGPAPTTCGVIHQVGDGAHVIPARPRDWPDPPDDDTGWEDWIADIAWSLRRALTGQTPGSLRALSFLWARSEEHGDRLIILRAEFRPDPSDEDLEALSVVESELMADFVHRCRIVTEVRALDGDEAPEPWPYLAYRIEG